MEKNNKNKQNNQMSFFLIVTRKIIHTRTRNPSSEKKTTNNWSKEIEQTFWAIEIGIKIKKSRRRKYVFEKKQKILLFFTVNLIPFQS